MTRLAWLSAAVFICNLAVGQAPVKKHLLVLGEEKGYRHEAVSHAMAVIEHLGEQTGLWDTTIRTDTEVLTKKKLEFNAKNLNDFDAILMFTGGDLEMDPQQKADFLSFIHDDGKGFIVAHAGLTGFFSSPEFGEMIGGRFDEHPWGIIQAPVLVEDAAFPGMSHLPPKFDHVDEYYQIKNFSREKSHVILGLDISHLDMKVPLVHHLDSDYPLAWAKMYGKGRVYASALGHDPSTWDDRAIQEMYFEAIKWTLGLTSADITPKPMMAAPERTP